MMRRLRLWQFVLEPPPMLWTGNRLRDVRFIAFLGFLWAFYLLACVYLGSVT